LTNGGIMSKRYSSWGSDKTYRWLWRAALQDAIFAFKKRYGGDNHSIIQNSVNGIPTGTKRYPLIDQDR